jgi:hypothetical protein
MADIYPRLQTPERRFVLLGSSGEDLKKPFEKDWQDTANYRYYDPKLAAHRGNYGVCGGFGDLHIIDCDDLGRWSELGVLPLMPLTFTIESRPGHRQFYVTCKERFQSGGLYDPEKTELNEQGKPEYVHIGDIKAVGGQAVGPGCKHPSGSIYTVIEDSPLAEVSREHLQSIVSRFKTGKKVNTNYKRGEEDASKAKRRKYAEKDPLDDLRVLDIMPPAGATSQSGDELRGDHPVHGSTNGGNYAINTAKNAWSCKRCESGGGAALAIAVKHGIISCSDAGPNVLRGDLFKEVMTVAREQGYIKDGASQQKKAAGPAPEDIGPRFQYVTKNDPVGTVGVCPATGEVKKVAKGTGEDGEDYTFLSTLSECALRIDTETAADGETEYTFKGIGAVDKREVCFTMAAGDMAVPAKFKAAVINAFGGRNQLGKLTYSLVQRLSLDIRLMLRIEVPCWRDGVPLLPGISILPNVEYRLPAQIPALVYDGDLDAAKAVLRKAMQINKSAPLLIVAILGAPVFARWFKNERFGLGIWGLTNSLKTSTVCALLSMWGTGYMDGPTLKSGRAGTTAYAATIIFASAGWLPQLLDNVKTVDARDAIEYVGTMNAVLEGSSKNQGTKDGGLRESKDFACTPMVTGEIRPQETSTTSRVPAIQWGGVDAGILREVQMSVATLPIIGYKWLMYLATVKDISRKEFNEYQAMKLAEFVKAGHTVAGRTATIYTMLRTAWKLLETSPFGDVFTEKENDFMIELDKLAVYQGEATKEETEVARFMAGLQELMQGNPGLFMDEKGTKHVMGTTIGKMMPEGVWLLPTTTLAELAKIKTFTQIPNIDSMTEALDRDGCLVHAKDDNRKKYKVSMNGAKVRGWYVKLDSTHAKEDGTRPPGTEKQEQEAAVPEVPTVPGEKAKINNSFEKGPFQEESEGKKNLPESPGTSGTSGTKRETRERDRVVDSDIDVNGVVPGAVPGGTQGGIEAEQAQATPTIGPHPRKDEPSPTKKRIRSYSDMITLVPFEYDSPIEESICKAFRGLLVRGIAPRLEMMIQETGLDADLVKMYLNDAPWIRKDDSSPSGIVVYLPVPVEAEAKT